ncbi:hypothetical protein [Ensifer sp. MJa1]|uniref:hypothetical protein n=1 Tax=Ensifer sp. MJa1 TaxID=2919888 RepID=UPI00300B472B
MPDAQDEMRLSTFKLHEQAVQAFVGERACRLDAIELGGDVLVVLTWLGNAERGLRKPEYVLPISAVKHQDLGGDPKAPCRWILSAALPKSLFDGTASRQFRRQFGVETGPAVTLPLAPARS